MKLKRDEFTKNECEANKRRVLEKRFASFITQALHVFQKVMEFHSDK